MRELGFEYDPSTAGSSVRFDPPSGTDRVCNLLCMLLLYSDIEYKNTRQSLSTSVRPVILLGPFVITKCKII